METTHVDKAVRGRVDAAYGSNPHNNALVVAMNANTSALLAIHAQLERIGDILEGV